MEYKEVSVHIKVSCLALTAPTIAEPAESLKEPAVLVGNGSHCSMFSWSLHAINIGSIEPVLAVPESFKGSAPKQITCLSTSDTITCNAKVGVKLAPAKLDKVTALVSVPLDSSQ